MKENTSKSARTLRTAVLLHDIRSIHNVGSIFRTSDAFGIVKIYISGYSPCPTDRFGRRRQDLAKVALGAEDSVQWEQIEDPIALIKDLAKEGFEVIALEQAKNSVNYKEVEIRKDTLIIFGNEVSGVPKNILDLADVIAEIPMKGKKESLNVSVAAGIFLSGLLG